MPHPGNWENLLLAAGAEGTLLLAFKNPALKPLTGKTLAEVAKARGVSPRGRRHRPGDRGRQPRRRRLFPDERGQCAARGGAALGELRTRTRRRRRRRACSCCQRHIRAPTATSPACFAEYVRENHTLSLAEAVRRLASLPADNLSLKDRGRSRKGAFADVVVFDPETIQDHATYQAPHQLRPV